MYVIDHDIFFYYIEVHVITGLVVSRENLQVLKPARLVMTTTGGGGYVPFK